MSSEEYYQKMATLADKLDLLLLHASQPNGSRYKYEDIERKTGVKASTISRIRSGANEEPAFRTILAIAEAFEIPLTYFSTPMTIAEAESFAKQPQNIQILEEIAQRYYDAKNEERSNQLELLAMRTAKLDDAGIRTMIDMVDYILSKTGVASEQIDPKM